MPIINIFALQTIREEKGLSWTVGACHLQRLLTLASVMYMDVTGPCCWRHRLYRSYFTLTCLISVFSLNSIVPEFNCEKEKPSHSLIPWARGAINTRRENSNWYGVNLEKAVSEVVTKETMMKKLHFVYVLLEIYKVKGSCRLKFNLLSQLSPRHKYGET
jgi:hypothetical protein